MVRTCSSAVHYDMGRSGVFKSVGKSLVPKQV